MLRQISSAPGARERAGRPLRLLCIGGEDHHLRLPFLRALAARGYEVHAAGCCDPEPFAQSGIPFHPYAFSRRLDPLGDWRALRALLALVDRLQPDIAQSFDTKPNLYLAALSARRPHLGVVRTINGTGRVHSSGALSARCLRPLYALLQRQACRPGAITVFQNEADRILFEARRMVRPEAARLIAGSGIDVPAFDRARAEAGPATQARARLRAELGLTAPRIVITVTRIEPLKGIRTLFAAAELVHRVDPDVQFVLVGPWENTGSGDPDLRARARRSPALTWIGPRSDIPALLALADLFVFPTEFKEGLPRVLLEAALAGLPIVTTAMPGCMSVVRHGRTGLVVPPRAPGALAAAVLEILAEPARAQQMGARGSALVRNTFSLARVCQDYGSLYAALARAG